MVCASPAYLERFGCPQQPDDLAAHRCITFDGLEAASNWSFAAVGAGAEKQQVAVHSRLTVSTADAAIAAAILGLGVTRVLSYRVADPLREGRLVCVLAADEPPAVPASLIYPAQGRLPMKSRAFIDFTASRLRGRLGAMDEAATRKPTTAN